MKHYLCSLVMGAALLCSGCVEGPISSNTPAEMYTYLLGDPVPGGVTNLQGVGDTWQGYNIYLRFNADAGAIKQLLATEYVPMDCQDNAPKFTIPEDYNKFSPSWSPEAIDDRQCYEAKVSNSWTGYGKHYLTFGEDSDVVHFHGRGI